MNHIEETFSLDAAILRLHEEHFPELEAELRRIYAKAGLKDNPNLLPVLHGDLNKQGAEILISGINPSYPKKEYRKLDQDVFDSDLFKRRGAAERERILEDLIQIQKHLIHGEGKADGLKQLPYFRAIKSFSEAAGLRGWDHVDIFPHRVTSQDFFMQALKVAPRYEEAALGVFIDFLSASDYKVVCLFNSGASGLVLGKLRKFFELKEIKLGIPKSDNQRHGFYTSNVCGKPMRFFLYRMLSGRGQPKKEEREQAIKFFKTHLSAQVL